MTHDNPPDELNSRFEPAKRNLVLIHGLGVDHRMWARQLPLLETAYHVFNPDLPGFGGEPPILSGKKGSVVSLADWLGIWLDANAVASPVVAGYSMGATVGLVLAARRPDLVSRLVLAAGVAKWGGGARSVAALAPEILSRLLVAAAVRELEAHLAEPGDKALVREMFQRADRGVVAALVRELATRDYSGFCSSVACPVMVISGECDRLADPGRVSHMVKSLPDAACVEIGGGRHYFCLTHADFFAEKIVGFGTDG